MKTKVRVIAIEPIREDATRQLLAEHGSITVLSEVYRVRMPSIWATLDFSGWLASALEHIGYVPEDDYIALQGSYLALSTLIATVASEYRDPTEFKALAYCRNGGNPEYRKVTVETV